MITRARIRQMRFQLALGCFALCACPTSVEAEPSIQVPHAIERETWFTPADYPPTDQTGSVSYRVMIGLDGLPTSCDLMKSSGSEILDRATCDLVMKKAHFTRASTNGVPEGGSYYDTVDWRKKRGGVPFTVAERTTVIQFDVDEKGRMRNCSVEGGVTSEEMSFCSYHDRIAVPLGAAQRRNVHVRQTTRVDIIPR